MRNISYLLPIIDLFSDDYLKSTQNGIKDMLNGKIMQEESVDNRRILPIFFPPPIITYLYFPFQLSIILAHKKTEAWFYTNYIQLFSKLNTNSIWSLHFFPDIYMVQNNQYFIDVAHINEQVMEIEKRTIVEKVREWINNGYYVCVILAESKLPGTQSYGRKATPHPQFLFGYDLSDSTFKMTNFNHFGKYSVIDIKFDVFENALFSDDTTRAMEIYNSWDHSFSGKFLFILYKFNNKVQFKYELDIYKIKESFEDYLLSKDTSILYKREFPWILEYSDSQWGLKVYENLIYYLENLTEKMTGYQAFHGLWEHKKIMTSRLMYLEKLGYLNSAFEFADKYRDIENCANYIRLNILKSSISSKQFNMKKLVLSLKKICQEEEAILTKVHDLLKDKK